MFVHILLASVVAATFAAPTSPPIVKDQPLPTTFIRPPSTKLPLELPEIAVPLSAESPASRPAASAKTLAWVSDGSKTPASTAKLLPVIEHPGTPPIIAVPPLQVTAYAYAVPGLIPVEQPVVSSSYSIEQHGYHITY